MPSTDRAVAIVPLRSPGVGKTRLSAVLDGAGRAALAGAMLADVVAALADSAVDGIVVAAAGPGAVAAASALGLDVVVDPPGSRSLDRALAAAARAVEADATLVVTADLPLLRGADVDRLLASEAEVVIAPTDDGGTGGLLRRPPTVIGTAYGPGSAERHRRLADAARATVAVVDLPGFRQDVDTAEDLRSVAREQLGPRTATFLEHHGLDERRIRPA